MTYKIITSHPWQEEEREIFQQLCQEICDAADQLWQFETSLLLLDAASEWREKPGGEGDTLDAIEFFLCTWLRSYRPRIKSINKAVDSAFDLSQKLEKLLRNEPCNS